MTLKERRRLVLMVRETPLHSGHLRNMLALAEMGAIIAPPVPAFYSRPASLDEMVDHTLGRVLDLFGIDSGTVRRWGEDEGKATGRTAANAPTPAPEGTPPSRTAPLPKPVTRQSSRKEPR